LQLISTRVLVFNLGLNLRGTTVGSIREMLPLHLRVDIIHYCTSHQTSLAFPPFTGVRYFQCRIGMGAVIRHEAKACQDPRIYLQNPDHGPDEFLAFWKFSLVPSGRKWGKTGFYPEKHPDIEVPVSVDPTTDPDENLTLRRPEVRVCLGCNISVNMLLSPYGVTIHANFLRFTNNTPHATASIPVHQSAPLSPCQ